MSRPSRPPRNDFERQVREEVEQETRTSRYRDRFSGERVHPYQHDVNQLLNFVIAHRLRHAGALAAVHRADRRVDTEALRFLVFLVLECGTFDRWTRRRCARIVGYCDTLDTALAVLVQLRARLAEGDDGDGEG